MGMGGLIRGNGELKIIELQREWDFFVFIVFMIEEEKKEKKEVARENRQTEF